ncbi:cap-binding protein [Grosmannia clavigera kw1407]|uniref:Cap-binding protein n=1 Tax=Grosmannia clavigera (strain kw1407 / UAMH 11150) TaxID=655863 RepID=F0XRE3_GROCL|nr:cap-binding protein [Grosmannia clavigera kw1407]EFX00021.1 cap-binding protein [Grosmannia clavigera kw1407]
MADYERRGGGGGGGGYHNSYRKRRFRDDDNDYRNQRRRQDVPAPLRIRRQLLTLAESPLRRWHDDAVTVARLVADNDDDAHVREGFVQLACQLVREQPLKTPFVAAVLLVVNTLKPAIVLEVLRHVAGATEEAIAAGQWREVKLHLRLLACLQTCLQGDGVFPLLDMLFERAVDLQTASSDDVIGTELVKIILLTIPYIMAAAPGQEWQQQAADLMEKTDVIASEPHALQKLMDPYLHGRLIAKSGRATTGTTSKSGNGDVAMGGDEAAVDDNDEDEEDEDAPPPAESLLALLQKQLQAEAASGWPLACLPRPWKLPLEDVELQSKLDESEKHTLPEIAVPATVVAGPRPLFPEVYFSVYGAGAAGAGASGLPQSVPAVTSVAASLIRDSVLDTINVMHFNRNVTARFLIDVDCYFADETFVKRATPFDRLRELETATTWKPEDVAVDAVFSQLLQLPMPEHKLVYYHAVLAEACKIAPAAIAPSLGRAIRYLYRHSHRMDLELVGRFVDWFSHHLSNFGFTWKWAEWVDDVALPDIHPHKAFILGAIDKEIRLSFAQRIKNTLPEPYKELIKPETEKDVPAFKFQTDDTPFAAEGRELAALLKRKAPDEEVQTVIGRIQDLALDSGRDEPLVASMDVFTTAVLWVGSKSLSHVLACIERTKDRFLDAGAASEAARSQILEAVMTFWAAHPGIAVSITEKLLNYAILSPETVVKWALDKKEEEADKAETAETAPRLSQAFVAELVFNTVAKVTRRMRQVVVTSQAASATVVAAYAAVDAAREQQQNPGSLAVAAVSKLFQRVAEAVEPWAAASSPLVVRAWAERWQRVVRRRQAIEEAFLAEAAKARMAAEVAETEAEAAANSSSNKA